MCIIVIINIWVIYFSRKMLSVYKSTFFNSYSCDSICSTNSDRVKQMVRVIIWCLEVASNISSKSVTQRQTLNHWGNSSFHSHLSHRGSSHRWSTFSKQAYREPHNKTRMHPYNVTLSCVFTCQHMPETHMCMLTGLLSISRPKGPVP